MLAALPAVGGSACVLGTAGSFGADRITQKSYDAASQLLKVTKALGTSVQADEATYTYSSNGKPLRVQPKVQWSAELPAKPSVMPSRQESSSSMKNSAEAVGAMVAETAEPLGTVKIG
jgi:hypothetical protein